MNEKLLKHIENLKQQKWNIMPLRIKAFQKMKEAQREFNKLWKEERDTERMIFEAMEKLK